MINMDIIMAETFEEQMKLFTDPREAKLWNYLEHRHELNMWRVKPVTNGNHGAIYLILFDFKRVYYIIKIYLISVWGDVSKRE